MTDEAPFTVTAQGRFTSDGAWAIEARVEFSNGPPPLDSGLLAQAEVALRAAIAREAERGKALQGYRG